MSNTEPADDADPIGRVLGALHPTAAIDGLVATATYHPEPEHRGNPGWLHGGMAATLLDHISARAAAAALGGRVVTGTLDLRYRQPVDLAEGPFALRAESTTPRRGTVRTTAALSTMDGQPLVEAKGLFISLGRT